MPPNTGATFPVGGGSPDLLITEVNNAWGMMGSGIGPVKFWERFGWAIFRDTVAGPGYVPPNNADAAGGNANIARLRFPNAIYKLMSAVGVGRHDYKGDRETRNFEEIAGKIITKPLRAERIDGPSVPFDCVTPTADPEGDIERAVENVFQAWGEFLPLIQWINVLVNGRLNADHPVMVPYTQDPDMGGAGGGLFRTDHLINPLLKGSKKFPNLIKLAKPFDEGGWAGAKDTILQVPELDGVSLPNAFGIRPPLIMVSTEQQWRRFAHVLGGPSLPAPLLMTNDGNTAAIQSMYVGGAELMIVPYLFTLALDQVAILKTAFVFPRGAAMRLPFIFREEVAPFIMRTGRSGALAHTNNTEALYIQARNTWGLGEPRSVFQIVEP